MDSHDNYENKWWRFDHESGAFVFDGTLSYIYGAVGSNPGKRIGGMSRNELIEVLATGLHDRDILRKTLRGLTMSQDEREYLDALLASCPQWFELNDGEWSFEGTLNYIFGRFGGYEGKRIGDMTDAELIQSIATEYHTRDELRASIAAIRGDVFNADLTLADIQTCPRRVNEVGPWEHEPYLDRWRHVGADRVCSFCGSLHPDEIESLLDRCLVEDDVIIDTSTRGHKIYIHRPEVPNASVGAIKYYIHHGLKDEEAVARANGKLRQALDVSANRTRALASRMREEAKKT